MRTTIEIPDALYVRAKTEAAQRSTSLKEFFIEALEEKMATRPQGQRITLPLVPSDRPGSNNLTAERIHALELEMEVEHASRR